MVTHLCDVHSFTFYTPFSCAQGRRGCWSLSQLPFGAKPGSNPGQVYRRAKQKGKQQFALALTPMAKLESPRCLTLQVVGLRQEAGGPTMPTVPIIPANRRQTLKVQQECGKSRRIQPGHGQSMTNKVVYTVLYDIT